MKLTVLAILVAAAALGAAFFLLSDGAIGQPRMVSEEREAMGTLFTITVYDRNTELAEEAIHAAFARISEIETVASPTSNAGEVSELNRLSYLPDGSNELVEMLRLAFIVNQLSKGAFDVTSGGLADLWRLDPAAEVQFADLTPESQGEAIAAAQEHMGMHRILLGSGRKTSVSLVPGTVIDLDGLAIGYAVDAAIGALYQARVEHARVEADGNLRVYGGKDGQTPWNVVIPSPEAPSEPLARLQLVSGAIATSSGTTEPSFDPIIDPRTGYPATAASSATVIAATCVEADALAAAAFVLGPEAGLDLIEGLSSTEGLIVGFGDPQEILRSSGLATFENRP